MTNQSKWTLEISAATREEAKTKYGNLFTELVALLLEWDPMGVDYSHLNGRFDEYSPEASTILPRLSLEAHGEDDVRHILEEELTNWFTDLSDRERWKIQEMTPKVLMLWQTYPEFHCS